MSKSHNVVLVPSLGRPASDFARLERDLAGAGFMPVSVEPFPDWEGEPTLHDLAGSVVANLVEQGVTQFHLIGHAFGNRLSRCITADFNSRVESLTLLAAGGLVEPEPHIWRALSQCYNTELSSEEHLSYVKEAFFADGNDPTVWRDGWMPEVMRYQRAAVQRTPRDEWWSANVDRVLVVQGLQDAIAPVENGRRYKAESAPHAQLVEINNAGHALLPEQPQAIAEAVLTFLSE
jgi:pimeloyl-ACP methyl ester carboxylesterase